MKKLLFKLRMWLLELLHGEPREARDGAYDAAMDYIKMQKSNIAYYQDRIRNYKTVVREICRRSEHSYYDWCCEYCCRRCNTRNGWCERFVPKDMHHD